MGGQARTLTVKNDVDFELVILLLTSQCFQNGYLSFELSRSFLYTVYIITELSMICRSTLLGRVKKMPQALDTVRLHQYNYMYFFLKKISSFSISISTWKILSPNICNLFLVLHQELRSPTPHQCVLKLAFPWFTEIIL